MNSETGKKKLDSKSSEPIKNFLNSSEESAPVLKPFPSTVLMYPPNSPIHGNHNFYTGSNSRHFEFSPPLLCTPTLREVMSPFSFRKSTENDQFSLTAAGFPSELFQKDDHFTSVKICKCKLTDCVTSRCSCHKNNTSCSSACLCNHQKCANVASLNSTNDSKKISFPLESWETEKEFSFRNICENERKNKLSTDDPLILYEKSNRKIGVTKKIEKLEIGAKKTFQRVLSKSLRKINP